MKEGTQQNSNRLIARIMMAAMMTVLTAGHTQAQTLISGIVTDRQTGKPLPHVSITAEGDKQHTVTNEEGRFTLKMSQRPQYIQLSHIGYKTRRQNISADHTEGLHIVMTGSLVMLSEVLVSADDPVAIVKAAINRIEYNYPGEAEETQCFYRETARRGNRFIAVAEAVTDMYKSTYSYGPERDAVAIVKGRRLMSLKSSDTLGVKIQGGPLLPLMVDVAKNRDYILNWQYLEQCQLRMETPRKIDDRLHYVVRMTPKPASDLTKIGGLLFIDQQTMAISRAELELDMTDWREASEYMLVSKPTGLRFRPKELSTTIVYNTDKYGITRISYLRNQIRFNCDWHRRLFAHSFTTVSEMVVTQRTASGKQARRPKGRSTFGLKDRFYDRVEAFCDPLFWADYNIIEPTESLENAIDRLRKRAQP